MVASMLIVVVFGLITKPETEGDNTFLVELETLSGTTSGNLDYQRTLQEWLLLHEHNLQNRTSTVSPPTGKSAFLYRSDGTGGGGGDSSSPGLSSLGPEEMLTTETKSVFSAAGFFTADLSGIQLCYSSYLFQSAADGGSVSEALAYAGQRACSQSLGTHGSQMLILGLSGVHLIALRTWSDHQPGPLGIILLPCFFNKMLTLFKF
ncbi:unnamed protein product [Echinostoma caproni]|uniref:MFS domain-containing protein n=1 Tax=Echinostoma caproni TaxID=27848 RepID=A0A183AL23_9TREM|nr:unnamed protein product [Echinostoma caproni]